MADYMEISGMTAPVAIVLLADPVRHRVVATKTGNGVTRGREYIMLAVNWKGEITVASPEAQATIVEGPRGKWRLMRDFDWPVRPSTPSNDNEPPLPLEQPKPKK